MLAVKLQENFSLNDFLGVSYKLTFTSQAFLPHPPKKTYIQICLPKQSNIDYDLLNSRKLFQFTFR